MSTIEYVLFDCIETLIDLADMPELRDYALWAFAGCGYEHCWNTFDEFHESYKCAVKDLSGGLPEFREYEMIKRFEYIVKKKQIQIKSQQILDNLNTNYWKTYSSKCFVKNDVREVLGQLYGKYKLGVVSNFMVKDGIEELLEINQISKYFEFVVTSIKSGWRKPHPQIFKAAWQNTGVPVEQIVFIGDNYLCDYEGAKNFGIRSILLDRNNMYPHLTERISNFYELPAILANW